MYTSFVIKDCGVSRWINRHFVLDNHPSHESGSHHLITECIYFFKTERCDSFNVFFLENSYNLEKLLQLRFN